MKLTTHINPVMRFMKLWITFLYTFMALCLIKHRDKIKFMLFIISQSCYFLLVRSVY